LNIRWKFDKFNKYVIEEYKKVDDDNTIPEEIVDENLECSGDTEEMMKKEEEIKLCVKKLKMIKNKHISGEEHSKYGFFSLLVYQSQRYIFLIMCVFWFSTSGIYYALSVNLKNLKGNIYLNGIIIYISEIFSYIVAAILMNIKYFGRIYSLLIFLILCFVVFFNFNNRKL